MKALTNEDKFVLSSSCKVVKGARRTLLNDYLRNEVRFIPNTYYDLIQALNRSSILDIRKKIDTSSQTAFDEFLSFMVTNEYAFIVQDVSLFPKISGEMNDDHVVLKDCIIEIDQDLFDAEDFSLIIKEIDGLNCDDIQIRFLKDTTASFVSKVLDIAQDSSIDCMEAHCATSSIPEKVWFRMIEKYATLSHVFIYGSDEHVTRRHIIHRSGHAPLLMGVIHHITSTLSGENCGVISKNNLSFMDTGMFHLTQKFNGCLYKKLAIDKNGYIKNCPFMEQAFGKVSKGALKKVLANPKFKSPWFIHKDEISVCKDCEFRYNCTDCRAFVVNEADPKSKPQKCGYDPYTNTWEKKTTNPLQAYATS